MSAGLLASRSASPNPTYLFPANVGYYEQLCRECNILAPGNEFNWANVERTRDKRGYGKLDQIAAFARDRDVKMIGHTLLWYHTIPKWLGELDSAGLVGAMEVYVSETVSRFRGLVARWDVVNEPIRVPDGPEGLRRSLFTERLGADYIKQAFAFAKGGRLASVALLQRIRLRIQEGGKTPSSAQPS